MTFEDLHEFDGAHTFFANCNESLSVWKRALDGIEVENAAGICSGGEVSFFALLPHVTNKLELIDHSYRSMFHAIGKYNTIEKLGAKEAYVMLRSPSQHSQTLLDLFKEGNGGLSTGEKYGSRYNRYFSTSLTQGVVEDDLVTFFDNREKITFLHGDLNDLVDRGPFDLVYLSNALEYEGREYHRNFRVKDMVKPGGLVLHTYSQYDAKPPLPVREFEVLFSGKKGAGDSYDIGWNYVVCKTPEACPVSTAAKQTRP